MSKDNTNEIQNDTIDNQDDIINPEIIKIGGIKQSNDLKIEIW